MLATIALAGQVLVVDPVVAAVDHVVADASALTAAGAAAAVRAGGAPPRGTYVVPSQRRPAGPGGIASLGDGRVVWAPATSPRAVSTMLRARLVIGAGVAAMALVGWALWAGIAQRREREQMARRQVEAVAMVVHDLRGPLMGIQLAAERLERDDAASARLLARETIDRECRRLAATADDILRLCTDTAAALDERADDAIGHVLDDVAARVRGGLGRDVAIHVDPALAGEPADSEIARAVGNLAENAARHARGCEPIRLCARRVGDGIEIVVEDDGSGFADARAHRPFRAHVGGGRAGLGLRSTRRIMERLGGSLRIGSRDGGGAAVSLHLPGRGAAR
ncbi:MAG: sensor histidine kinase [Gaiellales bacterium]